MDRNATIVDEIKKLIAETDGDEALKKIRKSVFVDGWKAAMGKVKDVIDIVEKLMPDGKKS